MQSILGIIILVLSSIISTGENTEIYKVINTTSHSVIVEDTHGNVYSYYQDIVVVNVNDNVIDIEGQLLRCDDNNLSDYFVDDSNYILSEQENECLLITQDFIIHIPYSLG